MARETNMTQIGDLCARLPFVGNGSPPAGAFATSTATVRLRVAKIDKIKLDWHCYLNELDVFLAAPGRRQVTASARLLQVAPISGACVQFVMGPNEPGERKTSSNWRPRESNRNVRRRRAALLAGPAEATYVLSPLNGHCQRRSGCPWKPDCSGASGNSCPP